MHPEDIKAAIKKKGLTQAQIARDLQVSGMGVSHVINGNKSQRIAKWISLKVGIPVRVLWPGKYPALEAEQATRVARVNRNQRKEA